jgi:major membrane immunogen (membrane-anchored lipoprotein)
MKISTLCVCVSVALSSLLLASCGEKQTTTASDGRYQGKADAKPWEVAGKDKQAWEAQLKARAQNQNEYTRTE